MTTKERAVIEDILRSYGRKDKVNILEWGSGSSTIYYAKYLRSLGVSFNWYSMENSAKWYKHVSAHLKKYSLDSKVHLYLFEFKPFWEKPGWKWSSSKPDGFGPYEEAERHYIIFPTTLGLEFDVIIIDGRFRRRCLIEAQKILAPAGSVILHDAQKTHYYSSLNLYKYGKFFESKYIEFPYFLNYGSCDKWCKMWVGSNDTAAR